MSPKMCGAGAPAREKPAARVIIAKALDARAAVVRGVAVLAATLREIFDESAYQRFLERTRQQSSIEAYAVFRQENDQAKSRRPKCC